MRFFLVLIIVELSSSVCTRTGKPQNIPGIINALQTGFKICRHTSGITQSRHGASHKETSNGDFVRRLAMNFWVPDPRRQHIGSNVGELYFSRAIALAH